MPVFLICIEDEIVDDCCETSSVGQSSSEWYESETPHMLTTEVLWKTRPSMERIRACHEEGKLSRSKVIIYICTYIRINPLEIL